MLFESLTSLRSQEDFVPGATWSGESRELGSTGREVLLPSSGWLLLVWPTLPLSPTCAPSGKPRLTKRLSQSYRGQCHGLLTTPVRQLTKNCFLAKAWSGSGQHIFSHLALPELDTLSSCLWFTPAKVIKVVCCKGWFRAQCWDTAPAPSPLLHTGEVLGIWNWRRNSLLGEFPSHHLPPGKHPGTDRQGRRSWQPASTEKP